MQIAVLGGGTGTLWGSRNSLYVPSSLMLSNAFVYKALLPRSVVHHLQLRDTVSGDRDSIPTQSSQNGAVNKAVAG